MASDDFYVYAGEARLKEIACERADALASLERAKLHSDYEGAGAAVSQIAALDAEQANMMNLYQRYQYSQNPPVPPPPTKEERMAKPWDRMNYADVWEMSRSKYGPPDEAMFRAGIAEAQRRRARGE
jgi:hypothetical protein